MLKYVIILQTPKLLKKTFYIFFSSSIRMSGNNITFDDKHKKLFSIYDIEVDKILISKKNLMVKKAHLNTFLDIMMMMMMTLDFYV